MTTVLLAQLDSDVPPGRLADWLAPAALRVVDLAAGQTIPDEAVDAVVGLGGLYSAIDDDEVDYLPALRQYYADSSRAGIPGLYLGLSARLLTQALGGQIRRTATPELGAYRVAKRDYAVTDPVVADLPWLPDVMQFQDEVFAALPPQAVLLAAGTEHPYQAYRVGASWALNFHLDSTAAQVRSWGAHFGLAPQGRLGQVLDDAEAQMPGVWEPVVRAWLDFVINPVPLTGTEDPTMAPANRRLPLLGGPR